MKKLAKAHLSLFQTFLLLLSSVSLLGASSVVGARPSYGLNLTSSKILDSQQQIIDNPTAPLVFGKEECKKLTLNHADRYEFEIKETEGPGYIHFEIMQKGIDVTLVLGGAGGLRIRRDWPNGRYGLEVLSLEIKAPGKYLLRIEGTDAQVSEGAEYCLRTESKNSATAEDVKRIEAEKAFMVGLDALEIVRSREALVTAVNDLKIATDLWRGVDDYGYATALTTYGYHAAFSAGLFSKDVALKTFNEALTLWQKIGDARRLAQSFHNIGQVYDRANQITEAGENYSRALGLFRLVDTPKVPLEEATTLNNLATIREQEGYYSDALELLGLAVKRLAEGNNKKNEAISLNNMGHVYLELEDHAMADESFKKAQELRGRPEFDPGAWATTLQNWGLSRAYQGDFGQAKAMLDQGLKIRTDMRDPRAFETRYSQGYVSNLQGDLDGALSVFEKEILPQLNNRPVQKVITLCSIGSIYRAKGDRQKALQAFQEALAASALVTNSSVVTLALFDLGQVEMELDFLEGAAGHLKKAIDLIEERRTRVISPEWRATYFASTRDVYETYIQLLVRMKKPEEALEYSERSRARTLVELLLAAKINVAQEPQNADRLKQYRAVQTELEAQQARLQALEFLGAPEARKTGIKARINALSSQLKAIDAAMKANSKSYRSLQPDLLKLADLQKLLEGDTVLLEFLLGKDQSYLWVLGKTGNPTVIPLPSRSEIEAAALKVYGLLTARDRNNPIIAAKNNAALIPPLDPVAADKAYPDAAAALSRTLLGEASDLIAGKRLLIVPDGALALIPFAALPIPSAAVNTKLQMRDWKPLLLEHVIVMLPSATALSVQRDVFGGRPPAVNNLAVVADPVFDSNDEPHRCERRSQVESGIKAGLGVDDSRSRSATLERALGRSISFDEVVKLPRLGFAQQEMNTILATATKGTKLAACGFDANYEVATKKLSDFRFVHFATHGLINTEHPELSGIVLSLVNSKGTYTPEGFLRLTDIYDLRLQADLVVLSSCYTALGRDIKGEGPISLTRGFMHAGARRVVASLWQVKGRSTAELMKYFYEGMMGSERLPAAIALRRAQIRVRRNHPDWPPFFWAAFIAQGEYN